MENFKMFFCQKKSLKISGRQSLTGRIILNAYPVIWLLPESNIRTTQLPSSVGQKEVIHDWMNHFYPILNKYNTVKKKLKAKVTERKELNVQKDKTSILNPIQHIKLNQQLTTITEEIEELKSRKEQLIFQAECSTDKDMTILSQKYDQMNKNLDILDSQDISLKKQLKKDAAAFREEKFRPDPEQYTELLDTRIQIRPDFRDKLIEQLKGTFGKYYDYHRRDIAANEVDYLNAEDPDVFSHRAWELEYQRKREIRRNQPAQSKKKFFYGSCKGTDSTDHLRLIRQSKIFSIQITLSCLS